jgi:ribosomal protein S12 methylthiotransferase accessory factor
VRDQVELRSMAADFDKVLALHDHPRLYGLPEMAGYASFLLGDGPATGGTVRGVAEVYDGAVSRRSLDLRDDVQECVEAVVSAGFDVIVVDQTLAEQRELGIHTASVIVPGLLPIDFGWRRQRALLLPRMRTALRQAGIVDHDLDPAEFNRAPHPFP